MEEHPVTENASNTVARTRNEATDIILGRDDRLLVVAGPCSIHDSMAAVEYGGLLVEAANRLGDDLCLVMRVYFEKPRTTVGWKGLINDPHLDGSFDINQGLRIGRRLLVDLAESGMPVGSEFLDTISPQFIADLVSWGAIGARTTESQVHRELVSGLSMPVGLKNGTDGNIQVAIVETAGNDACHLILRGSTKSGNYEQVAVDAASDRLRGEEVLHRVMVDCSHGNSSKDHSRQPVVAAVVAEQVAGGSDNICGVMLESHLVEGNQMVNDRMTYGQSITDACISWETTVPVLENLAKAVQARRGSPG